MYNYGGPYPFTAKYSKRIIERTYNWVKFFSNHAFGIHRADSDLDNDMDGYTIWLDCNDYDENINPGVSEISGNGIDDDCYPSTPAYPEPANSIALSYGWSSLIGSGVFNGLALLLFPMGAIIFLRILRRKR
jgi:hypothetical protein